MNEDIKKSKVERFVKDEAMMKAVFEVIQSSFLKSRGHADVQLLAAERLAVLLLDSAWKELLTYNVSEVNESPPLKQIGL